MEIDMSGIILHVLLTLAIISQTTPEYRYWNTNRRPKLMGDIIPFKSLSPNRRIVQQKIVLYHNFFRSNVQPKAANMLRMKWHQGAANAAQRWADACLILVHDNITGRHINNYGPCGQNIFIASHKVPWLFAIKSWWLEKDLYTFGSNNNNVTIVGHYTQMIWAATHEIGCGITKCYHYDKHRRKGFTFFNYVCNYCPIGNHPRRIGRPYRRGKPCGLCGKHCRGKLCNNSCPAANYWSNCKQLYRAHPHWLCHTNTRQGRERLSACRATCTCKHKIHD